MEAWERRGGEKMKNEMLMNKCFIGDYSLLTKESNPK